MKYFSYLMVAVVFGLGGYYFPKNLNLLSPLPIIAKPSDNPQVMAKIDGKDVLELEIIKPELMNIYNLRKKEYDLKIQLLREYVAQYYLQKLADEKGITPEEYTEKYIIKGKDLVSTAELDAFIVQQQVPADKLSEDPELRNNIKKFLAKGREVALVEDAIAKLIGDAPVEINFTKPSIPISIPINESPVWGDEKAKVTIVEFTDLECPFCAQAAQTVEQIKKEYAGKVKIVYKHLPLNIHPHAYSLAQTSMCIHEQDPKLFWKFYSDVFSKDRKEDSTSLMGNVVKKYKLKETEFQECLVSRKYDGMINSDIGLAEELGIQATPAFFINNEFVMGAIPYIEMKKIIEQELRN